MYFLDVVKQFLDKVFSVPIAFLDLIIERLDSISLVVAQGLNVNSYLSYIFGDMPSEWQGVISSLLLSLVLLISLLVIKSLSRMYFATKEGAKWW